MRLIRQTGFYTAVSPEVFPVTINSVNGGATPQVNQTSTTIVGQGFTPSQGTVTYNGFPIVVNSWTDTVIDVAWPDVPFNPNFKNTVLQTLYTLVVDNGTASGSTQVATTGNAADAWATISSVSDPGSIYANDTGIQIGLDLGYIRVTSGAIDNVNAETGVLSGITPGSTIEYAVFDYSAPLEWVT